jgi:CxxC motif-containing protein (DUF1111 family)
MTTFRTQKWTLMAAVCVYIFVMVVGTLRAQTSARDPGPRGGAAGAGGPLNALRPFELDLFVAAQQRFATVYSVSGGLAGEDGQGLGPTFNGNSCAMCHAQPAIGGTSPHPTLGQVRLANPQTTLAVLDMLPGVNNVVPPFITATGPIREARFITVSNERFAALDGSVHGLYTIAGRIDSPTCGLAQPDFAEQLANNNVVFRIPTALFGLGLVENTPDATLRANLDASSAAKAALGIGGTLNVSDDGTVARFGWKAQDGSLLIAAAKQANVELGVTNEATPDERAAAPGCALNATPEDVTIPSLGTLTGSASQMSSDIVNFAAFTRLLAPPIPTTATASQLNGATIFSAVGCNLCHSPALTTGASRFPGQSNVVYHPYSDFALHHMGANLADGVVQQIAGPDMFRTAPLWGVGQRVFFLHDGRTSNLSDAIQAHVSPGGVCSISETFQRFRANGTLFQPLTSTGNCGSEANGVVARFNALSPLQQQDVLNFLRSL